MGIVLADGLSAQGTVLPRVPAVPSRKVGSGDLSALGIRKLEGRHLTLYTDLASSPAIDELPQVFDQAVPQWCQYFEIQPGAAEGWKCVGSLMRDKERFRRVGLLPENLPPFLHGFQQGTQLWLNEQPSDYYRRHLLLHEGTHAFMHEFLGGAGPPWYMEGMAELLATHRWDADGLRLRYFPRSKLEVPDWGRVKIVKEDLAAGKGQTLHEIMAYDSRAHLQVNPYGWCWAMCAFLDANPKYHRAFQQLKKHATETGASFSTRFVRECRPWPVLERDWQVFIANIDYGFDITREAIQDQPSPSSANGSRKGKIAVDRGWQSTGIVLEAGKRYRITATGRYQIGTEPKIWWCEPDGVTIRYHQGKPLGMLFGAIANVDAPDDAVGFLSPWALGSDAEIAPQRSGTLYLRTNDHPAELADNDGEVSYEVTRDR